MHKVLLVDDEAWTLESIKAKVDWSGLELELLGVAANGLEAFERIGACRPDLVITDIRMPGMDGLTLIERTRAVHPYVRFAVISGYAEFEYAQRAINMGAVGYMLKSSDREELNGTLRAIKADMRRTDLASQAELLELLEETDSQRTDEAISDVLARLGMPWGNDGIAVMSTVAGDVCPERPPLPRGLAPVRLTFGARRQLLLFPGRHIEELRTRLGEERYPGLLGIGIGETVREPRRLREAVETAVEASYRFFVTGKAGVAHDFAPGKPIPSEWLPYLYGTIRSGDPDRIREALQRWGQAARTAESRMRDVLHGYHTIIALLSLQTETEEAPHLAGYQQLIERFGSLDRMIEALYRKCIEHAARHETDRPGEALGGKAGNGTLARIVGHIGQHYHEDLSIQRIADLFGLNPNYISQLFRKELGTSFTSHLQDVRLGHACRFLKETDLPVHEIAEKCGFSDYFYFAKVFKKQVSMKPSEYRLGLRTGSGARWG